MKKNDKEKPVKEKPKAKEKKAKGKKPVNPVWSPLPGISVAA